MHGYVNPRGYAYPHGYVNHTGNNNVQAFFLKVTIYLMCNFN